MSSKYTRLGILLAFVAAALTLMPMFVSAQEARSHSIDDALLLMISAQSRIHENYVPTSSIRLPGLAAPIQITPSQGASPAEINEQKMLGDAYNDLSRSLSSNSAVRQHLENKANYHNEQAEKLEAKRRGFQRRRNNIFGQLRRVGRAVVTPLAKAGNAVSRGGSWVFRGVGKVGQVIIVIAKDEVIIRAKNIVRAKVQDLVDIGSGKLDTVVGRIAKKFGMPAAELLREFVINPAFNRLKAQLQRNMDRLTGDKGTQPLNPDPTDDDEYNPDFSNVGEEGDTDYDDGKTPTPYPTDDPSELDDLLEMDDDDDEKLVSSKCPQLEIIEEDVRNNPTLQPDVLVHANAEAISPPAGYVVSYSPYPESQELNHSWRLISWDGARISASTDQAVECASVFLVGDNISPAEIFINGNLAWNGYLYPVSGAQQPNKFFYIRIPVSPPGPVNITIVGYSPPDPDLTASWVPVLFFGFDLP